MPLGRNRAVAVISPANSSQAYKAFSTGRTRGQSGR